MSIGGIDWGRNNPVFYCDIGDDFQIENDTQTIYTVPTGNTFYLVSWWGEGWNSNAGKEECFFYIAESGGGIVLNLLHFDLLGGTHDSLSCYCNPPFKIIAGRKLVALSGVANLSICGAFYGYLL